MERVEIDITSSTDTIAIRKVGVALRQAAQLESVRPCVGVCPFSRPSQLGFSTTLLASPKEESTNQSNTNK